MKHGGEEDDADARAIVRMHASAVLRVSEVGTSGIKSRDSVDPTEIFVRSLVGVDPYTLYTEYSFPAAARSP